MVSQKNVRFLLGHPVVAYSQQYQCIDVCLGSQPLSIVVFLYHACSHELLVSF